MSVKLEISDTNSYNGCMQSTIFYKDTNTDSCVEFPRFKIQSYIVVRGDKRKLLEHVTNFTLEDDIDVYESSGTFLTDPKSEINVDYMPIFAEKLLQNKSVSMQCNYDYGCEETTSLYYNSATRQYIHCTGSQYGTTTYTLTLNDDMRIQFASAFKDFHETYKNFLIKEYEEL